MCVYRLRGVLPPEITNIKLHISYDKHFNLIRGNEIPGVYVGISARSPLSSTSLIWQHFASYGVYPYAHASYVERFGLPQTWEDLDHHRIAGYQWSEPFTYLAFKESNPLLFLGRDDGNPRQPFVTTDDLEVCRMLIESGQAIGLLPPFLAQMNGFVPLFVGCYDPSIGIMTNVHYVIKPGLKSNKRVRAFVEFIKKRARDDAKITSTIWGDSASSKSVQAKPIPTDL